MKDRGKDAHQYDSLGGKFMLEYSSLSLPWERTCAQKQGWIGAKGGTRSIVGSREAPVFLFWQLWPTCTNSYLSYDMHTHTQTHKRPCMLQRISEEEKQRHLEKSSSGRHWHDLRGLTALPITLAVQLSRSVTIQRVRCGNRWLHS